MLKCGPKKPPYGYLLPKVFFRCSAYFLYCLNFLLYFYSVSICVCVCVHADSDNVIFMSVLSSFLTRLCFVAASAPHCPSRQGTKTPALVAIMAGGWFLSQRPTFCHQPFFPKSKPHGALNTMITFYLSLLKDIWQYFHPILVCLQAMAVSITDE